MSKLAWRQLSHEKRRLLAALTGISFAVVLMLTQIGFQDALLSSVGMMHSAFVGDIALISPNYRNLITLKPFTQRRLYQALSLPAVEAVYPVYLQPAPFKNPVSKKQITIYCIAFKPTIPLLDLPEIREQLPKLKTPGMVLFDAIRRPEFGPVSEMFEKDGHLSTEISGMKVELAGLFHFGTSFGSDGRIIMSDDTFLEMTHRDPNLIDVGLVKLKPGADVNATKNQLIQMFPKDVDVLTKQEFVDREVTFWTTSTPIGFVFGLGVMVGVFIGCIIVYQILYTDVTDHLPEYATLKAMGYRDRFLFNIVMQEALILSVLGFIPGVVIARFVYLAAHQATMLNMAMSVQRGVLVYFLTAGMCSLSGLLALRRLKAADPADIF